MPMTDADLEEMRGLISVARKRPLQFGLCLGKQPEGTVFVLHRMKDAEVLKRQAKKEGDSPRLACGEVTVKGKKMMLQCRDDIPAGIAKKLRQFLMGVGMKMKIVALNAAGEVLEDDGEEEEEDALEAEENLADEAVDDLPEREATESPDAGRWRGVEAALAALYERAMRANPANRSQLEAAWAMATEKAQGGDFATALQIAVRLKTALDKAVAEGGGAAREIPQDVVPFQRSRVLWASTRAAMFREMAKLEAAIVAACGNDPELAPVAAEVTSLSARLSVFDERLETILDQITNTAEGDQRTALKTEARGAVRDYTDALGTGFFQDVDNGNGFVPVAVAASARKSLDAIARVLG